MDNTTEYNVLTPAGTYAMENWTGVQADADQVMSDHIRKAEQLGVKNQMYRVMARTVTYGTPQEVSSDVAG